MSGAGTSFATSTAQNHGVSHRTPGHETSRLQRAEEADLTELAAPLPAQPDTSGEHVSGQDTTQKTQDGRAWRTGDRDKASRLEREEHADLTELSAPRPAQPDTGNDWHDDGHLESAEEDIKKEPLAVDSTNYSAWLTQLYTISYLVFFSLWGVLARLAVQWITFYPGAPVTIANLWANVGGSFFMGFLAEDRNLFRSEWGTPAPPIASRDTYPSADALKQHGKVKKTIPLYVGLTVGFCGSFTSFSTFERDVFDATANDRPAPAYHAPISSDMITKTVPRNGGYSFEALLGVILLTVGMSLSAHVFGSHLALGLDAVTPAIPFRFTRRVLDPAIVVLAWGCWLGAIFLTVWPPDRPGGPSSAGPWPNEHWRGEALFALVFAPVGCLLRFVLSLKLNARIPSFPLGTFVANMFGVAVLSMCYDLQRVPLGNGLVGGGQVGCQTLQGVMDGFCGALTTVSTWVAELRSLRRRNAYFYGGMSVVVGFCITIVLMGSVRWTLGYASASCQVETT